MAQSTRLQLLTRDGAVSVTFTPELNAAQYSELHQAVDAASTSAELIQLLESLAAQWKCELKLDPC